MYIAPFTHERIKHKGIYFPRNFIMMAEHVVKVKPIKYLGKYVTICLILSYEKEAIYMWQNSILVFYIYFRENYSLNSREGADFWLLYCSARFLSMEFWYWLWLRMWVIGRRA